MNNTTLKQLRSINLATAAKTIPDFTIGEGHHAHLVRIIQVHEEVPEYVMAAIIWSDGQLHKINMWLQNNTYHEYGQGDIIYVVIFDNMTYRDCMEGSTFDGARKYMAYICDMHGHIFDDKHHRDSSSESMVGGGCGGSADFDETETYDSFV